jgi:hypothetical protein
MSRTIRRKTNFSLWQEDWYTCESRYDKLVGRGWIYNRRVFKKGKEFKKGWWKFHGDGKEWRHCKTFNLSWSAVRAGNRVNIAKFFRDDEYDLIPFDLKRKRDWD